LAHLRTWFYNAIEPLAPARLQSIQSGDLLSRIMSDIETLEQFYVRVVVPPLAAALVTLVSTLMLGSFHPSLGLALLSFLLLTGLVLPLVSRFLSRQSASDFIHARSELNASLLDGVQGIADLLSFGQSKQYQDQIEKSGIALNRIQQKLALIRGLNRGLAALFTSLAGLTVLWMAIPLVTGDQIEGIFLALLPLAAIASFEAVQPLSQSLQLLDSSYAAAGRLFFLIDAPPPITEPRQQSPTIVSANINVSDLSFRYDPNEPKVLNNVKFSIEQGQSLAIIGPSGSGKSTIVNLLLRFWDYEIGHIKLDHNELRDYHSDHLRRMISVISQHTHIFNSTIRDNLHLANPAATEEELLNACRLAQMDRFINSLPLGFDTLTGENGLLLSGGERQRLAVARAILKDAPILILDEATANLDAETERQLWKALEEVMVGRTTLIISHRTDVIPQVDKLVYL
jgi:thiol reductant ABC exporter CydC subunit